MINETIEAIENYSTSEPEKAITRPLILIELAKGEHGFPEWPSLKKARTYSLLHYFSNRPEEKFMCYSGEMLIEDYKSLFDEEAADFETQLFILIDILNKQLLFKQVEDKSPFSFFVDTFKSNPPPSIKVFATYVFHLKQDSDLPHSMINARQHLSMHNSEATFLTDLFAPKIHRLGIIIPNLIEQAAILEMPEREYVISSLLTFWEKTYTEFETKQKTDQKNPNYQYSPIIVAQQLIFPIQNILEEKDFSTNTKRIDQIRKLKKAWWLMVSKLLLKNLFPPIKKTNFKDSRTTFSNATDTNHLTDEVLKWSWNPHPVDFFMTYMTRELASLSTSGKQTVDSSFLSVEEAFNTMIKKYLDTPTLARTIFKKNAVDSPQSPVVNELSRYLFHTFSPIVNGALNLLETHPRKHLRLKTTENKNSIELFKQLYDGFLAWVIFLDLQKEWEPPFFIQRKK